jgi:hypothetical protein
MTPRQPPTLRFTLRTLMFTMAILALLLAGGMFGTKMALIPSVQQPPH